MAVGPRRASVRSSPAGRARPEKARSFGSDMYCSRLARCRPRSPLEGDARAGPGARPGTAATRRPDGKGLCAGCAGGSTRAACMEPRRGCNQVPRRNSLEDDASPTAAEDNEQCIEPGRPNLYVLLREPDRVERRAIANLARPSRAPSPGAATSTSARCRLTVRAVDADHRTAGDAPPARPPRGRRHRPRSPGTSPATAAARRPRSASGSPSTAPAASPDARDASPEDERRSAAGRSRCRSLPPDPPRPDRLRSARAKRAQDIGRL